MGKYAGFRHLLGAVDGGEAEFTFNEIEDRLNISLPSSARSYRSWWGNDESHVHARDGWLAAGWKVAHADVDAETVVFHKADSLDPPGVAESEAASSGNWQSFPEFETYARKSVEEELGEPLYPGEPDALSGLDRVFDFVSEDGRTVGEAKLYTSSNPGAVAARASELAETAWLLQEVPASTRFIVLGGERAVAQKWIDRYGGFADGIELFFLEPGSELESIWPPGGTSLWTDPVPAAEIPNATVYAAWIRFSECPECGQQGHNCYCWETIDDVAERFTGTVTIVPCEEARDAERIVDESSGTRSFVFQGPLPSFPQADVVSSEEVEEPVGRHSPPTEDGEKIHEHKLENRMDCRRCGRSVRFGYSIGGDGEEDEQETFVTFVGPICIRCLAPYINENFTLVPDQGGKGDD